jgi:hypothetical protein
LKFDLYVQGFSFVAPDAAQYQISGSSAGSVTGSVNDKFAKKIILSRTTPARACGGRRTRSRTTLCLPSPAKRESRSRKSPSNRSPPNGNGEIYVSDFDGFNPQAITHDSAIVAAPAWVPGRLALYYTSYQARQPGYFLPRP